MYYLITYAWYRDGTDVISMEVWEGPVGEWMIARMEEPEHWRLLNASEINENEYFVLSGCVE